jgi:hypothetical protein
LHCPCQWQVAKEVFHVWSLSRTICAPRWDSRLNELGLLSIENDVARWIDFTDGIS